MTRWSKKDLTGILLDNQKDVKGDQWDVVEFPAIMGDGDNKKPVWPQYWKMDELESGKSNITGWKMERTVGCKSQLLKKGRL